MNCTSQKFKLFPEIPKSFKYIYVYQNGEEMFEDRERERNEFQGEWRLGFEFQKPRPENIKRKGFKN